VSEPPGREPVGLSVRAKALVSGLIGVLYAVGMSLRGEVLPGIVGGILAGILCFLVLREIERQRRERRR
jgi:fructose-specific phosphotransferase system IIC component